MSVCPRCSMDNKKCEFIFHTLEAVERKHRKEKKPPFPSFDTRIKSMDSTYIEIESRWETEMAYEVSMKDSKKWTILDESVVKPKESKIILTETDGRSGGQNEQGVQIYEDHL